MEKFDNVTDEALVEQYAEKKKAFDALRALETPTVAQVGEAKALAAEIREIKAEQKERETAAQTAADEFAELKDLDFDADTEAPAEAEPEADPETEEDPEPETEDEPAEAAVEDPDKDKEEKPVKAASARKIAAQVSRPALPETPSNLVTITAAQDVPGFATGASLDDMDKVGEAVINRMKGFSTPTGNGQTEDLRYFGVAQFRPEFDEDLVIDRHSDDMEVLARAADETRLPGESLTAASGWCAPSETLYDLWADETTDGILSVPEVQVKRGGIKYTMGPQFSTLYADTGFYQTEAQAIADTEKPCYLIPCPTFTEVRLGVVGLCLKIPILQNAAYPEVTQRVTSGSMVAHQHRVNARVIAAMATAAGAARVFAGLGSTASDSLEALALVADQRRQSRRMSLKQTLEVVVPFWVKNMFRADMERRTGVDNVAVQDAAISAYFSVRGLNVQFVYDWQPIDETAEVYPATYQVLTYVAGTFIKGVSDVINLSAVYDAASLALNTYTGLFMEQGLLVAQMRPGADLLTLPVCNAGRSGINDLTCA